MKKKTKGRCFTNNDYLCRLDNLTRGYDDREYDTLYLHPAFVGGIVLDVTLQSG
jgi:hypothetical protein